MRSTTNLPKVILDKDDICFPFLEELLRYLQVQGYPFYDKKAGLIPFQYADSYDFTQLLQNRGRIIPEWAQPDRRSDLKRAVQEANYEFIERCMATIPPYPGVCEFIERISGGHSILIVTSCQQRYHELTVRQFNQSEFKWIHHRIAGIASIGNEYSGDPFIPIVTDVHGAPSELQRHIDTMLRAQWAVHDHTFRPTKGHIGYWMGAHRIVDDGLKYTRDFALYSDKAQCFHVRHPWGPDTQQRYPNIIDVSAPTMQYGYERTLADMAPYLDGELHLPPAEDLLYTGNRGIRLR